MQLTQSDPFKLTLPTNAVVLDGQVVCDLTEADAGGAQDSYDSLTDSDTFPTGVNTILCDATSGELTVTLPKGGPTLVGVRRSVIKTDNSVNAVILAAAAGDLIEGAVAQGAATRYSRLDVVWSADGQWRRAGSVMSPANYLRTFDNLSNVTSPKLSRQNIGANVELLSDRIISAISANAEVARLPWPFDVGSGNAFLIRLDACLLGASDGEITLTTSIGGVPATPVLSLPAGAAGARASINYSGGNLIPADCVIDIAVGGANTADVGVAFTLKCIV